MLIASQPSPPILHVKERKDLKQEALDHIHSMLLCEQLQWGDRVSEEAIARQIGISRTPVREALHLYCQMGIFKRLPRFGTIVQIPEVRSIEELFEVRIALETYAVSGIIGRIDADALAELEAACDRLGALVGELRRSKVSQLGKTHANELYLADYEFHIGIIRATGNRALLKHISDNRMLTHLLGDARISGFDADKIDSIRKQHHGILDAIRNKDTAQAVALLTAHIHESKSDSVAAIRKKLDQMEQRKILRSPPVFV